MDLGPRLKSPDVLFPFKWFVSTAVINHLINMSVCVFTLQEAGQVNAVSHPAVWHALHCVCVSPWGHGRGRQTLHWAWHGLLPGTEISGILTACPWPYLVPAGSDRAQYGVSGVALGSAWAEICLFKSTVLLLMPKSTFVASFFLSHCNYARLMFISVTSEQEQDCFYCCITVSGRAY